MSTGNELPWAWTHNRENEMWNAGGRTRESAIAAAKRSGHRKFYIAQTRKMDAAEKESYEGSYIVNPTTEERFGFEGKERVT